jgi:hypothetical protein
MPNLNIETLLNKTWTNLLDNYKKLENNKYPGVYILAYTDKDLEEKPIDVEDIFYVGMSNSKGGVKQRLKQFIKAISIGKSHSAGNRFFKEYSKGPFNRNLEEKDFYVASLSLPCTVEKSKRTPEDLRKMGEVAKFEYDVIAYVKENTYNKEEPELNVK